MEVVASGSLTFKGKHSMTAILHEIGVQIESLCPPASEGMAYCIDWKITHGYLFGCGPKEDKE